jgi:hypothetical protein
MHTELQLLDALRDEWQALQPLSAENEARLWKKLRLEWNYHSNHIEGNTLTYGETELLLLHDRTTGNHSHREYLEMKAHDVGIEHVRNLAADKDRLISESDIRDLNRIILKEPFWKYAETLTARARARRSFLANTRLPLTVCVRPVARCFPVCQCGRNTGTHGRPCHMVAPGTDLPQPAHRRLHRQAAP